MVYINNRNKKCMLQTEEEIRAITSNISGGVCKTMADEAYTIISCNEGFSRLFGYSDSEILEAIDYRFINLVYEADREMLSDEVQRQLNIGSKIEVEYRAVSKDNSVIWILEKANLVVEEDGAYYYSVLVDITAQKNMLMQLSTLTENMNGGIVVVETDEEFSFAYLNEGYQILTGYSEVEIKGNFNGRAMRLVMEEDRNKMRSSIQEQLRAGSNIEVEHRIVRKDGEIIWVLMKGRQMRELSANVQICCVIIDITKSKETENRLRISEERYKIALEQSEQIVFDYDIQSKTIYFSEQTAFRFKLPVKLQNVPECFLKAGLIGENSRRSVFDIYRRIENGASKASGIHKMKTESGGYRWLQVTLTAIYDENGKSVRAIGVVNDITRQKEAERKFKEEYRYRRALLSKAVLIYEVNITENIFLNGQEKLKSFFQTKGDDSYSSFLEKICGRSIFYEDAERVRSTFSLQNFREAFAKGKSEIGLEYRYLNGEGEAKWIFSSMHMIEDPVTNDLKGISYIKDIDEEKKKSLALLFRSERDSLSGLYNKGVTEKMVKKALTKTDYSNGKHALMLLDIDNFKAINDNLGHAFGDAILSEVSASMKGIFRQNDILGRIGGDEFLIFMLDVPNKESVGDKAQQILNSFQLSFMERGIQKPISASIGISIYPEDGKSFEELYINADVALYTSKKNGKSTFSLYERGNCCRQTAEDKGGMVIESMNQKYFQENIIETIFRLLYFSSAGKETIEQALMMIARHFMVCRGYLYIKNDKDVFCRASCWCEEEYMKNNCLPDKITAEELQSVGICLTERDVVVAGSVKDSNGRLKGILLERGVRAVMLCAIRKEGRLMGFLGFEECRTNRIPTQEEMDIVAALADVVGGFWLKKQAEEKIEEENKGLKSILDHVDNYIYVINPDNFELLYCNAKMAAVLPEFFDGQLCYEVLFGRERPCGNCPCCALKRGTEEKYTTQIYFPPLKKQMQITAAEIYWTKQGMACLLNGTEKSL